MLRQRANILLVAKVVLFAVIGAVGCQQYQENSTVSVKSNSSVSSGVPTTQKPDSTSQDKGSIPSESRPTGTVSSAKPTTNYSLKAVYNLPFQCNGVDVNDTLVLFSFGQSISSNFNEKTYSSHEHVYTLDEKGECVLAQDPLPIADGKAGSMWMPLAGKIIESGSAKNVLLVSIGVGGSAIERWTTKGDLSQHLETSLEMLNKLKIPISMFLWHQGTSNMGTLPDTYHDNFLAITKTIRDKGYSSPILVAIHSRCFGSYDKNLEAAQNLLAQRHQDGLFLGANTNLLDESYRFDTCHLNAKGQEQAAQLWFNAIKETDQLIPLLKFGW